MQVAAHPQQRLPSFAAAARPDRGFALTEIIPHAVKSASARRAAWEVPVVRVYWKQGAIFGSTAMRTQLVGLGLMMIVAAVLASDVATAAGRAGSELEAMGLGSLVVMSDDDAMSVRGQGYKGGSSVAVSGNSFATINSPIGGAHSENAQLGRWQAQGQRLEFVVRGRGCDQHGRGP